MDIRHKYLQIFDFLNNAPQMIFISGPRQSGKTTFAKERLKEAASGCYLNWDIASDRKQILGNINFDEIINRSKPPKSLVVLDEIHKYSDWKNYLKGHFDANKDHLKFLVTGSGRLDFFQKGKDSLAGRYFLFHIWPLTVAEFCKNSATIEQFEAAPLTIRDDFSEELTSAWDQLSVCSGFPDPFFSGNEKMYRVWSDTYRSQLIYEDVRQLTRLEKIDLLEKLVLILPYRVGGTLSIDNLASDLQIAFDTVKKWLLVLERFFVCFRISTWSKKISRSITKEQKLYLFDYAVIKDPAVKFENMVAIELLRAVRNWRERGEGSWALHFVRDRDQREVDFLITKDNQPFLLVEAKWSDEVPSQSLIHFQQRLGVPAVQLVGTKRVRRFYGSGKTGVLVSTAADWLGQLP